LLPPFTNTASTFGPVVGDVLKSNELPLVTVTVTVNPPALAIPDEFPKLSWVTPVIPRSEQPVLPVALGSRVGVTDAANAPAGHTAAAPPITTITTSRLVA
jgi:hypothetical protein